MVLTSRLQRRLATGAALAALAFQCAANPGASGAAAVAQVDRPAPEVDVKLLNGKLLRAKDLRGKVIVSVVWATWSPAARMELPDLQKLYAAHRERGLEVVALSIDENVAEVKEFWRARGFSMPVGMRSDAFFDRYGRVTTTPMFYIVDRQGVLRHRIPGTVGPQKLEALVRPLLAEPPPESLATLNKR